MKKEVQLIKKSNGKLCLIAIDDFLERLDNYFDTKPCEIITNEIYGWWIHEKSIEGGGFDGIGSEEIVRDITNEDIQNIIENNKGKCYIDVNYDNILSIPKNGRGDGKIVIFLKN